MRVSVAQGDPVVKVGLLVEPIPSCPAATSQPAVSGNAGNNPVLSPVITSSLLQLQIPVLGEPWGRHRNKLTLGQLCLPRNGPVPACSRLGFISMLPFLLHFLQSQLDHRFLCEAEGWLHT